jgi:hypothetical protein
MVLGLRTGVGMPRRLEHLHKALPCTADVVSVWAVDIVGHGSILALTIVGLPFHTVVLLAIVVAWIFGCGRIALQDR